MSGQGDRDLDFEDRLDALRGRVDAFFDSVQSRHASSMQCGSGCHDCCHTRLSVTLIEAAAIARHLLGLPDQERIAIAEAARSADPGHCAALDADGLCRIYAARPLVCRSHGVPIRRRDAERSLPVVDVCPRNFRAQGALEAAGEGEHLDQETLSTILGALDAAFCDAHGAPRGMRVDLAELLADPGELFETE